MMRVVEYRRLTGQAGSIIIDDQDADISYDGDDWWDISDEDSGVYNGSLSQCDSRGTFQYSFTGTSASGMIEALVTGLVL